MHQVPVLAVHGDERLRLGDGDQQLELVPHGVARGVDGGQPRVHHFGPRPAQAIYDLADIGLVPGYGVWTRARPGRPRLSSPICSRPTAISDNADMGSPCEPVQTTHIWLGSKLPIFSISIRRSSGICSKPSSRAKATLRPMDRPNVAM